MYDRVSARLRRYLSPAARTVLAAQILYSTTRPDDGLVANVPFFKRVFLGGSESLRGWGRYEVSPLGSSGVPIGGLTMLAGNVEARFRFTGRIGSVLFLDAGNVRTDPWRVHLGDLRFDVGTGSRYNTPFGLTRLDFG